MKAFSKARPSTRRRCFASRTISTRLNWAKSIGGLKALMARADANTKVLADWKAKTPWIDFLAKDAAIRSNTSVCLKIVDPAITSLSADAQSDFSKKLVALVEKEGRRLRLRALPRCAGGPAHLVRRDRRSQGRRAADAVDRLGVRRDQGRAAEGGVSFPFHLSPFLRGEVGLRSNPGEGLSQSALRLWLPLTPTLSP